jgi:hypothetical protein
MKVAVESIMCQCGHEKEQHAYGFFGCMIRIKDNFYCACQFGYRPDNLKHIEILALQKGLV